MSGQEDYHDKVKHVSGNGGSSDIFQAGRDVGEAPDKYEAQGHETLAHHKQRKAPGKTDAEILKEEGADLPHTTHAGNVEIPGPADKTEKKLG